MVYAMYTKERTEQYACAQHRARPNFTAAGSLLAVTGAGGVGRGSGEAPLVPSSDIFLPPPPLLLPSPLRHTPTGDKPAGPPLPALERACRYGGTAGAARSGRAACCVLYRGDQLPAKCPPARFDMAYTGEPRGY